MTEAEFIRQAQLDWEDNDIVTIVDAMEACYGNGAYDDVTGDAEAPTGHVILCERWIMQTDSNGINSVTTYDSTEEAETAFKELDEEFAAWDTEPNV